MDKKERNVIAYIVACINEFSRSTGLNTQETFKCLDEYGGIDFLTDFYDTEHVLSFDDVVDDLKTIIRKSGGKIA